MYVNMPYMECLGYVPLVGLGAGYCINMHNKMHVFFFASCCSHGCGLYESFSTCSGQMSSPKSSCLEALRFGWFFSGKTKNRRSLGAPIEVSCIGSGRRGRPTPGVPTSEKGTRKGSSQVYWARETLPIEKGQPSDQPISGSFRAFARLRRVVFDVARWMIRLLIHRATLPVNHGSLCSGHVGQGV